VKILIRVLTLVLKFILVFLNIHISSDVKDKHTYLDTTTKLIQHRQKWTWTINSCTYPRLHFMFLRCEIDVLVKTTAWPTFSTASQVNSSLFIINTVSFMTFEVLATVKCLVFCRRVTLVGGYQCFGGTRSVHHQGWQLDTVSQPRKTASRVSSSSTNIYLMSKLSHDKRNSYTVGNSGIFNPKFLC
jgi:hypothetical protein